MPLKCPHLISDFNLYILPWLLYMSVFLMILGSISMPMIRLKGRKKFRAGFYSTDFALSYTVGRYFDNFNAEIASVSLALDEIEQRGKENM
ncbi:hypothetical protein CEXT_346341 [Caerostris extrusa]|uniref:Uncharacterized protein n=1 Tax=Caerostris extrusa TaxID=172846 RepID=A0AAV4Q0U8_CAEEX|nr:hypothetical protein CEXT_346341 [Caerostris extrusa]